MLESVARWREAGERYEQKKNKNQNRSLARHARRMKA
jgi:hypothetical protein